MHKQKSLKDPQVGFVECAYGSRGRASSRKSKKDIWIVHTELPSAPGRPFYQRLNELLEAEKFDEFCGGTVCEVLCGQSMAGRR